MSTYINSKAVRKLINKMSGWQRKQWGKAGYPETKEELEKFTELTKDSNKST